MKTLSLLQCEAFQAGTSWGELSAKERKEGRRAEHETIADGPTPGGEEKSQWLSLNWSKHCLLLLRSSSPRINVKTR